MILYSMAHYKKILISLIWYPSSKSLSETTFLHWSGYAESDIDKLKSSSLKLNSLVQLRPIFYP